MAGFTLAEALVTIAIVAVLAALALPGMNQLLTTQRVKSTSFDLMADLTYARSEAIARGTDVVVASTSGTSDWREGWTITETAGPSVLREAAARADTVIFTGPGPTVTFERTGRATALGTVAFSIQPKGDDAPDNQKRCLRLDPSGRARSAVGVCS